MHHNAILRDKLASIQAKGKRDREWWDQEKATIQSNFMKELDEDQKDNAKPAVAAPGADRVGSDEDAVLVEGGGPAASGASSSAKGAGKKRKGKK